MPKREITVAQQTVESSPGLTDTADDTLVGAWAGLGFSLVYLIFIIPVVVAGVAVTDPASEVRPYLEDNAATVRALQFVIILGFLLLLLPFVVALSSRLRRAGQELLSGLTIGAALLSIVVWFVDAARSGALTLSSRYAEIGASELAAIWDESRLLILWLFHLTFGVWVASASLAAWRTALLPRWVSLLGLALLPIQIAAGTFLITDNVNQFHDLTGGVSILAAILLWMPAVSITILRRRKTIATRLQSD